MVRHKFDARAQVLRGLHKPGSPVLMVNVWDAYTAKLATENPNTKAITTASWAIAEARGVRDNDLSLEDNLAAIEIICKGVTTTTPMAADLQDGYADIRAAIQSAIKLGVVGANIEDVDNEKDELRSVEDAVGRIRLAMQAAAEVHVPNFVVNARTDVLRFGGTIEDAIERGRKYLHAGALTVYVWGGPGGRGVSRAEVAKLVEGLGGMVNVKMNLRPGFLNAAELAELGVARISVGPELYHQAMAGFRGAMEKMQSGKSFT